MFGKPQAAYPALWRCGRSGRTVGRSSGQRRADRHHPALDPVVHSGPTAQRIGIDRVAKDVTPSLAEYVRSYVAEAPQDEADEESGIGEPDKYRGSDEGPV